MSLSPERPPALHVRGVEKWFGPLQALRGVDFALRAGEFLTLLGPNGAGKTTLLRILCGALRPTRGEVLISGLALGGEDASWRRRVSLLSHQSFLYPGLTAAENLHFYARLYALPERSSLVDAALADVGLWERRSDLVRTYSRGMRQRLALARTLLHDPRIVFLDEPYTGLDAHAAVMLNRMLARLREQGRTVLLVTHNLMQGLELADRVAVQVAGRWVLDAAAASLDAVTFATRYSETVAAAETG